MRSPQERSSPGCNRAERARIKPSAGRACRLIRWPCRSNCQAVCGYRSLRRRCYESAVRSWVIAACRAGVIGAFPTANARSVDMLDDWLTQMGSSGASAPYCANLIIRQPRLAQHLDRLIAHRVELVITSVGAPDPVLEPLHEIGCLVFADVATVNHARKAVAAGVDGLVLLTAGAGGQTGWLN